MHFRLAVVPEINYLSTLVADAFKHYALYQQTIGQTFTKKADYQRFIQQLHAVHVAVNVHLKKAFVVEEQQQIVSVVILDSPQLPTASIWQYLKYGGLKLLPYVLTHQLGRFLQMLDDAEKVPQQDQQANWHVNLLAVNPAHQGQQIGSKTLTQFVLPYVKKHGGQQVSLITNTARNMAFYQKNTFQVIDERLLAFQTTQVKSWALVRQV